MLTNIPLFLDWRKKVWHGCCFSWGYSGLLKLHVTEYSYYRLNGMLPIRGCCGNVFSIPITITYYKEKCIPILYHSIPYSLIYCHAFQWRILRFPSYSHEWIFNSNHVHDGKIFLLWHPKDIRIDLVCLGSTCPLSRDFLTNLAPLYERAKYLNTLLNGFRYHTITNQVIITMTVDMVSWRSILGLGRVWGCMEIAVLLFRTHKGKLQ